MFYFKDGKMDETNMSQKALFILTNSESPLGPIVGDEFHDESFSNLLDGLCVSLYDKIMLKVFESEEEYHSSTYSTSMWVKHAGHDSDNGLGRDDFEKFFNGSKNEITYKHLYFADCENLIGFLQSRIAEVKRTLISFYIELAHCKPMKVSGGDEVVWIAGESTTTVFSHLMSFITNLYSTFDILTKICYLFEHLPREFKDYHLLPSKIQYGNHKALKKIKFDGTIFEGNSTTLKLIETLRHELIHNGYWESLPKVFARLKNGEVVEKWIFMPDSIDGVLASFKNRKRFFSGEIKANDKLLEIYVEVVDKLICTIEQLCKM